MLCILKEKVETLTIGMVTCVVAIDALINVSLNMLTRPMVIYTHYATLYYRPKSLDAVCRQFSATIESCSMVNIPMVVKIICCLAVVPFISVEFTPNFDMF